MVIERQGKTRNHEQKKPKIRVSKIKQTNKQGFLALWGPHSCACKKCRDLRTCLFYFLHLIEIKKTNGKKADLFSDQKGLKFGLKVKQRRYEKTQFKENVGTSLEVQGILRQMQGIQVRSLMWEDHTCHRATKPMCHNY